MKKAATKFVSVYWFVILFLVAGGIFLMSYNFYNHPLDVRGLEAKILAYKVADCISWKGETNIKIFNETDKFQKDFDLLKDCGINFNVEDEYGWSEKGQYFVNVTFYHLNNDEKYGELKAGNPRLFSDCESYRKGNKRYESVARCFNKRFYALTKKNHKQVLVDVFTAVRKTEKNVK